MNVLERNDIYFPEITTRLEEFLLRFCARVLLRVAARASQMLKRKGVSGFTKAQFSAFFSHIIVDGGAVSPLCSRG
jgi:hypothetical protein|tara:strand:- start:288 stop:515 length:228 start_codon:yes stop_codon:yes gene_type:complete